VSGDTDLEELPVRDTMCFLYELEKAKVYKSAEMNRTLKRSMTNVTLNQASH
jgi:hypothetical protein